MERSILIVEPDLPRRKEIARLLIQSGYDALVSSGAESALRQLYRVRPDAVILSNQLPATEIDRLSDAITTMADLPLIELTDGLALILIAQRLAHSTEMSELVDTLDKVLEAA